MPGLDRYHNPSLCERLAAQYVLGTLRGRARVRFEQLVAERPYLHHEVERWEARLNPLAELAPAVTPPARVWRNIHRELVDTEHASLAAPRGRWWNSLLLWRGASVLATLALAMMVLLRFYPLPGAMDMPEYVAILNNDENAPMVVAAASRDSMELKVRLMNDVKLPERGDLELWCILKDTGEPWSMGVLPARETTFRLTRKDWDNLRRALGLAVSMEPKGGARSDVPTGPVMYKGEFIPL